MENTEPVYKKGLFQAGIVFTAVSALLYYMPQLLPKSDEQNLFSFFFIHYGIAVFYLVVLWGQGVARLRWRFMRQSIIWYLPAIILLLISAYALNREVSVFHLSVNWLSVLLVLQCINLLLFSIYHMLQKWLKLLMFFMLGIGLVLFTYLAVYVAPLYTISAMAFIFLGISGHSFVPLLFVISIVILFRKFSAGSKALKFAFMAGIIIPFAAGIYFAVQWSRITNIIDKEYTRSLLNETDLPAWVRISQRLPKNTVTEKVLKADMIYTVHKGVDNLFRGWDSPGRARFNEEKKHDPLVVFASLFNHNSELDEKEKIKILESTYDSRHQAQERLWSGENLRTKQVITSVRLWPEYRMAYTEKILSIENTSIRNRWNRTEEALYTFHLPEGAVITSLSLWIAGKEEKGYLTSKQKADSAYKTIVGVETRDPSLVHWQEGNTVSVRVFPCTPDENRRFKLGITSPLQVTGNQLTYENIYFDGPLMDNAKETRIINTVSAKNYDLSLTKYSRNTEGSFEYEGSYDAEWKITAPLKPLKNTSFTFNNKTYTLSDYKEQQSPVKFSNIYLDLNAAWKQDELKQVVELANGRPIYTWLGKWFEVNKDNYTEIFNDLSRLQFSMLPLYEIDDRKNSLVITKGTSASPNLRDVAESVFHARITELEKDSAPVKTFCLGNRALSPYLKTLKEFRMIQCENGEMSALETLLKNNIFPQIQENAQRLLIQPANILITETAAIDSVKSSAPDHFFRLFAYNQIMKNAGVKAIRKDFADPDLVELAEQAYVVSPVSSLIVLESQKDYERFGIEESKNSLGNASMKSSGAVPEPHEWALIVLILLTLSWLIFKERLRKTWQR